MIFHGIAVKPQLTIETGRGVLTLELEVGSDKKVHQVRVDAADAALHPLLQVGVEHGALAQRPEYELARPAPVTRVEARSATVERRVEHFARAKVAKNLRRHDSRVGDR